MATGIHAAVSSVFRELVEGADAHIAWVLNPADPGLLRSLDRLSAADASRAVPGGGSSVAAHVDHLRYGLQLLNRWTRGENPFADADYRASWRRQTVSEDAWATLRGDLRAEARTWLEAIAAPRELTDSEWSGIVASVAHLAYHLAAIRQIDRSTRGPSADD